MHEDFLNKLVLYLGGYSAILVALVAWVGTLITKKIVAKNNHNYDKKLEILKAELSVEEHHKKHILSKTIDLRPSALEEIHRELVGFGYYIDDVLNDIMRQWQSAFIKSNDKLKEKNDLSENPSERELQEIKIQLESRFVFAKEVLVFIAYNSFEKWNPELKRLNQFIQYKEIYIEPNMYKQINELIKEISRLLNSTVQKLSTIALEVIKGDGLKESTETELTSTVGDIKKQCFDIFFTNKQDITEKIKNAISLSATT